ncbi:hypothetical protein JCM19045_4409 [Bacillus sp. JCM 19045]|nr:hypothetical protein JCM19045_4409 [Bacillus sp. JCM 19045]
MEAKWGVSGEEWRLFLHSLIGTSASIGLIDLTEWARERMARFEQDEQDWLSIVFLENDLSSMPKRNKQTIPMKRPDEQTQSALVLIVDHDPIFLTELKNWLEAKGYMVLVALTAQKALQLAQLQHPSCLLLNDFFIRDSLLGLKVLNRSVRELVPVFIVSEADNDERRITAYNQGAADFVAKPVVPNVFGAQLANRIRQAEAIQSRILTDPLTGAYNRRFLEIEGNRHMELFQRGHGFFSVAMLDLDYFKRINDEHGHLMGDEVLRTFSKFVQKHIREGDLFIRYGGEEFMLLLPHTNAAQAKSMLERLRQTFVGQLFQSETGAFNATFSAGVCEVSHDQKNFSALITYVDQALYKAKEAGRNRTVLYGDFIETKTEEPFQLIIVEDDAVLRRALVEQAKALHVEGVEINVSSYENGTQFIGADWFQPDGNYLISLDRMMPGLDGLDVLAWLRKHFPESQVMVLMLTSYQEPSEIAKALKYGTDDYMTKPFDQVELIARMRRLIERSVAKNR